MTIVNCCVPDGAGSASADAGMISCRTKRTWTGFNVAETAPVGLLGKDQREELDPAGKTSHSLITLVAFNDPAEHMLRYYVRQLGKDSSANMHAIVSSKVTKRKKSF